MKLELKHLAAYLPYGLEANIGYYPKKVILDAGKVTGYPLNSIKPILRPISDLTKEIEVNGEKFVPIERIKESNHHLFFRDDLNGDLSGLQYSEFQKLLEWNFDIFRLIDNGLAIDINTIK